MNSLFSLVVAGVFTLSVACATTNKSESDKTPPKITHELPLDEALKAAIDFGGDTARDVRRLVSKRKQWPDAEKILSSAIEDGIIKYSNEQLMNAVMVYSAGQVTPTGNLFRKLVSSGRPLARQLGWQMAAALPSKVIRQAIDQELNRALLEGDEKDVLIPQMAAAVQANRLNSAYGIVKEGLMTTGHEDFATALTVLNPLRARDDLIDYLALCPPEELRQMTLSSVNLYSATIALNHLTKHTPNLGHPNLEIVFFYAISRNPGLSDLAMNVIEILSSQNQSNLAIALSRLPSWAQIAFIESSRRNMSSVRRVFLSELRKVSAQAEIQEELADMKF